MLLLDLARIKLIFVIVADMVLSFRFVTNTVLIPYQYFSFCGTVFAQHQGLLFFSAPPVMRLGVYKSLGGDTARQMI